MCKWDMKRGESLSKQFELNEKQLKAAELLAKGETKIKTAEMVTVNRKTIDRWLEVDIFKAEVDRQVSLLKSKVNEKISMNIEPLMDKLINIALKSDSEKTSLDAIIYAINRLVGTPTSKVADVTEETKDKEIVSIDDMLEQIDTTEDNVIDLKKVK